MKYKALSVKWRPKNFSDLVGQNHISMILTNSILLQRVHHAYLFSGSHGIGKTTVARLFAKCLFCKSGITIVPCQKCSHCVDIELGNFVDLIEVDAASKTRIEDIRELLDNVHYVSYSNMYKIYIIDEVHMLSNYSFNALLNILEESPVNVKFFLATTELKKIPETIISRCLHLNLRKLSVDQIYNQLKFILHQESIDYDKLSLKEIAQYANGSMRDAINILDQAISMSGNKKITCNIVHLMLGSIDIEYPLFIIESLIDQNIQAIDEILCKSFKLIVNWDDLYLKILYLFNLIAKNNLFSTYQLNLNNEVCLVGDRIIKLSRIVSFNLSQLYYYIFFMGYKNMLYIKDDRMNFEMTLFLALSIRSNIEGYCCDVFVNQKKNDMNVIHKDIINCYNLLSYDINKLYFRNK